MNNVNIDEKANEFFSSLNAVEYPYFIKLYKKAVENSLIIKKDKTKNPSISFYYKKYLIMRFINNGKRNYIRLKYYNCQNRGEVLERALIKTIEEHDFKYTGCYRCGECEGKKRGYIINNKNNKKYFRCGRELIEVLEINKESLLDIENALIEQIKSFS